MAVSGTRLWVKHYTSYPRDPARSRDGAQSVAVSPDGTTVFVTGGRYAWQSGSDYATIAYNAATGARLWIQRYNGPANGADGATSVAVSPAGDRVYVTGYSAQTHQSELRDYATVAYNAATGTQLWVSRYNIDHRYYTASSSPSVAVSATGERVFVNGSFDERYNRDDEYATVAYNAATGARLWASRYSSGPDAYAHSVAVSPAGDRVFVTGYTGDEGSSNDESYDTDYTTIAYNAATGARLWVKRYNGPGPSDYSFDFASSVAVSPAGDQVFVTGSSAAVNSYGDFATVAYNAATGAQLWVKRYNGPGNKGDGGGSVAVSPAGDRVYVSGGSTGATTGTDYETIAYNAATGTRLWAQRYNGPANGNDGAYSMALSPTGDRVYVTGYTSATPELFVGRDYATVAYNAATGAQLWVKHYNGSADEEDTAYSVAVSPTGDRVFVTGFTTGTIWGMNYTSIAYRG